MQPQDAFLLGKLEFQKKGGLRPPTHTPPYLSGAFFSPGWLQQGKGVEWDTGGRRVVVLWVEGGMGGQCLQPHLSFGTQRLGGGLEGYHRPIELSSLKWLFIGAAKVRL